jgi:hypothetical protein
MSQGTRRTSNDSIENRLVALETGNDFELTLDGGSGHGSTNTVIRRYANIQKNTLNTVASYIDSATLGMSVLVNVAGTYAISVGDSKATVGGANIGISVNSVLLTTAITGLTYAQGKRALVNQSGSGSQNAVTVVLNLLVGDIIRSHTEGTVDGNSTNPNTFFKMTKVG